jgi:hypothetical protein
MKSYQQWTQGDKIPIIFPQVSVYGNCDKGDKKGKKAKNQ